MNIEIKKLTRQIYLTIVITVLALLVLFWFFTRSFATLKVTPSDATVTIDNAPTVITSAGVVKKNLAPGYHTVKVEADGYIGTTEKVDFKRGFAKTIEISLKSMPKPVQISADATLLAKGSDFNDGYYVGDNGKTIYKLKISPSGDDGVSVIENKAITDAKLSDIKEIIWSPSKDLALFRKTDGSTVTLFDFMKYDFIHQTETAWGKETGSIAWSPDNSKIAYYYTPASGERSLIFADITNTVITRVANFQELGINNPLLSWSPDSQWLTVIPRNSNADENKIYLFDTYSRTIKPMTDNGNQLGAKFSPDNNKILYSTYSKDLNNPVSSVLSIMNKDGSEKRSLDLRADLNKVVWDKDSRHIVVATMDSSTHEESIFKFNTEQREDTGFMVRGLGNIYIKSLSMSDDGKMVLYEIADGIYALRVE